MLLASKTNLEPTVLVNLSMGLLVLILAFIGACCRQVYAKHTAREPLLLTVEPKGSNFLKMEIETEKSFNGRIAQDPRVSGNTKDERSSYPWTAWTWAFTTSDRARVEYQLQGIDTIMFRGFEAQKVTGLDH
ncbi:hypothetical protein SBOR_5870 [Sclerotinia borealis F-4128]|uniref:Uncharacterized protein n=1 Tax=Sclerotinia borealis (strain F-4128) TaxID=1432307 RepID=W9CD31_SCLBF|nr:hypothetical protein SBOR_5870 [Sclerotinia borealis F-4128]